MQKALRTTIARVSRAIIALRYRIEVKGLEEVRAAGRTGILFLPSHLALIDPAILMAVLDPHFHPHPLADEYQASKPIVGWFARSFGAKILPNLERRGREGVRETRRVLDAAVALLRDGENLLFYPAGRLRHDRFERLRAASGTHMLVQAAPDARVVLVRQTGLWGSSFSRAYTGRLPDFLARLARGAGLLLVNGLLFTPRRRVLIELAEPDDFPRGVDRMTLNAYLEEFYNQRAPGNTYVPYTFWERGGTRVVAEPRATAVRSDASRVPETTRGAVLSELARLSGRTDVNLQDRIAEDLGLDSISAAEFAGWIESEFGHRAVPECLVTAADAVLAAGGQGRSPDQGPVPSGRGGVEQAPAGGEG